MRQQHDTLHAIRFLAMFDSRDAALEHRDEVVDTMQQQGETFPWKVTPRLDRATVLVADTDPGEIQDALAADGFSVRIPDPEPDEHGWVELQVKP